MEVSIFSKPQVARVLSKFVEVRLHTDKQKDATEEARSKKFQELELGLTGSNASPVYLILDPAAPDRVIDRFDGADLTGTRFQAFLERNAK